MVDDQPEVSLQSQDDFEIIAALAEQVNFASHQNAVPLIRELTVRNNTGAELDNCEVRMSVSPNFVSDKTWPFARIGAGNERHIADRDVSLNGKYLLNLSEAMKGQANFTLVSGEEILVTKTHGVEVLARNEWGGFANMPELLASFSMPNDPAVDKIIGMAADALRKAGKDGAIEGYASQKRTRVWEIASALWSAVRSLGINYIYPPASFERTGQKIRTPSMILESRVGTCLDLTMLFCSLLEQSHLRPLVVMMKGHAFVGLWLQPEEFRFSITEDPATVRKRLQLNEMVLFETTLVTNDPPVRFSDAVKRGVAQLGLDHEEKFVHILDLQRARDQKIRPLSFADTRIVSETEQSEEASGISAEFEAPPELPDFSEIEAGETPQTPEGRLDQWQRKLLDLSARNPLLNHRGTASSIALLCPDPAELEDLLAAGNKIRILELPDLTGGGDRDEGVYRLRNAGDLELEFIKSGLARNEVYVRSDGKKLDQRLVTLFRKARSDLEEGGANTLFLAIGFLRWSRPEAPTKVFKAPLILVPAELKRKSVRSGPVLLRHDDEARFNTTLLQMLRQDFDLDIRGLDGELPTDASGIDVPGIWDEVRREVRDEEGLEVVEDVVLGTFSFAKYLMWKDLVDRTDDLRSSPVVKHLLDTPRDPYKSGQSFTQPSDLDSNRSPGELFLPLPADSSQVAAVVASGEGKDFVIIGPPGTGKSQTISNMIAHNLALGRKVLFVSEKQAALNVVYKRLKEIGLGPFCLELHSNKARKLEVLGQFKEAWETSGTQAQIVWQEETTRLENLRDSLNGYVQALHKRHRCGLSVHIAIGLAAKGEHIPELRTSFETADQHSEGELQELRELARRLRLIAGQLDDLGNHPLAGIGHDDWSNAWQQELVEAANQLSGAITALNLAVSELIDALKLNVEVNNANRLTALQELAKGLRETVGKRLDWSMEPHATDRVAAGRRSLELIRKYQSNESKLSVPYSEEPWRKLALDEALSLRTQAEQTWWLASLLKRRKAAKLLRQQVTGKEKPNLDKDIDLLLAMRELGKKIDQEKDDVSVIYKYAGSATDVAFLDDGLNVAEALLSGMRGLNDQIDGLAKLRSTLAPIVEAASDLLAPGTPFDQRAQIFEEKLAKFDRARDEFSKLANSAAAGTRESATLDRWSHLAGAIVEKQSSLNLWCSWRKVRGEAQTAGLNGLVTALESGLISLEHTEEAFETNYARWWVAQKIDAEPILKNFAAAVHEDQIESFKNLVDRVQELAAEYVKAKVCGQIPDQEEVTRNSDFGVLRREIQKQRRHKPLRQLFTEASSVLPTLTPCVLMSPLSVAQYLPATTKQFDLVIFDEASQITVWDAVGTLARGKQAVVAGDPNQMPPTNFFGRQQDPDLDESDIEEDLESILDEMLGANMPKADLNWHYRSKDEGLIAFSNANYYGGNLVTFPAPETSSAAVSLRKLDGVYQRGKGQINSEEARALVDEVVERLLTRGDEQSIGVVTFNSQQQTLIENMLDDERRENPEIETYFSDDRSEAVFVKNLEAVQGDERDVILFSITFGHADDGKISMNFGPMNQEGGHRRLNVAITRAREEMVVFSTITANDIDLTRTAARGVSDLKAFLDYADRGPTALGQDMGRSLGGYDSPFEESVANRLRDKGWTVHTQIGVGPFRVDLGVVHPKAPGRYLIGVECDGATYHRSATARDRDKVRESVLSRLGWDLLRVWSTDYWIDPRGIIDKLDIAIREKVAVSDDEQRKERHDLVEVEQKDMVIAAERSKVRTEALVAERVLQNIEKSELPDPFDASSGEGPRYAPYREFSIENIELNLSPSQFYENGYNTILTRLIEEIVLIEGPISEALLLRRISRAHDFQRAGNRIRERVLKLAKRVTSRTRGSGLTFYWPKEANNGPLMIARRPQTEEQRRLFDDISDEELSVHLAINKHVGDPVYAVAQELRIARVSAAARARLERLLNDL